MRHQQNKGGLRRYGTALSEGLLRAVPFVVLTAGLTLWLGRLPAAVLRIPVLAGWGAAAFFAGRRAGRLGRLHGLRTGAACGGMLWVLRIAGALWLGLPLHPGMWGVLGWMVCLGALGGVTGVNGKPEL